MAKKTKKFKAVKKVSTKSKISKDDRMQKLFVMRASINELASIHKKGGSSYVRKRIGLGE